jgi:hypothetical protein
MVSESVSHAKGTARWYDVHVERPDSLADYVDALQERGRYTFSRDEALAALGSTPIALKPAAERLKAKRRLGLRPVAVLTPSCRSNTGNQACFRLPHSSIS